MNGHQPTIVSSRPPPPSYPVSVKGVVVQHGKVLLLHNERSEWELPGGRLEIGETPEDCVAREIAEETGWEVRVTSILDSWLYYIAEAGRHVFIVTYGCHLHEKHDHASPVLSSEHQDIGLFGRSDVTTLRMPEGYKRSVETWYAILDTPGITVTQAATD